MSYALGVQLSPEGVSIATTVSGEVLDAPVELVPPVLFFDGSSEAVGADAVVLGADQPQSLVTDVVGQFTVDRIFLTAGRILQPDDVMRELLGGVVAGVVTRRGTAAGAVTVSCPPLWDGPTQDRIRAISEGLGFAQLLVIAGWDAAQAAGDAATRLPREAPSGSVAGFDLPAVDSGFATAPDVERSAELSAQSTAVASRSRAVLASIVALCLLALGVVVVLTHGEDTTASATTTVTTSTRLSAAPLEIVTTTVPTRALVLGLLSDGTGESSVRDAVAQASGSGGVFGRAVELVVQPASGDVAATVDAMVRQGVVALIAEAPEPQLATVIDTAAGADLALCISGAEPATPATRSAPVLVGSGSECALAFVLAAESAGSLDRPSLRVAAAEILDPGGVKCVDLTSCRNLIGGGNPVFFQPPAGTLRLSDFP